MPKGRSLTKKLVLQTLQTLDQEQQTALAMCAGPVYMTVEAIARQITGVEFPDIEDVERVGRRLENLYLAGEVDRGWMAHTTNVEKVARGMSRTKPSYLIRGYRATPTKYS